MEERSLSLVENQGLESRLGGRALLRGRGATRYRIRQASCTADIEAAQALRFEVFNLELNEGLASSYATGRDADPFDAVCDHLLVEEIGSGDVVGTYRLQTGRMATANRGFYSAQEFDFGVFDPVLSEMVELGRACVHRSHRNLQVLSMLWRGIGSYAQERGCRYLVGCSSIPSQDPRDGASVYLELGPDHLVEGRFRTHPTPFYTCPLDELAPTVPKIPPLLRAYLSFGARICGAPALDAEFKTIDFLTWLDLQTLPPTARRIMG
jgi:putative hemolysin